jgi:hypothetical protein
MTDHKNNPVPPDRETEAAIRERIIDRAKNLTSDIIDRLTVAVDDLSDGRDRAALGALAGIEQEITTVRSILLLLS